MRRSALLCPIILAIACGGGSLGGPSDFLAITWRLQSIDPPGKPTIVVGTPERYTLRLDEEGQAGVRADCNSCGGQYTLAGDVLDLPRLACTRAFCGDDSLDGAFVAILGSGPRLRIEGSTLVLSSSAGTLRFTR